MSIQQYESGRQMVLDIVEGVGRDLGHEVEQATWRPTHAHESNDAVLSFRFDGRQLHFEVRGERLEDAARDANVRTRMRNYLRQQLGKPGLS